MPKLNSFQRKIQNKRNKYILKLAQKGLTGQEIANIISDKYGKISRTRIHQILQGMIEYQEMP